MREIEATARKTWQSNSAVFRLVVYTASNFVFGMICSALGPTIPWLAEEAGVPPESLGWLPAAQAVMCIASGLASSLMGSVPRRYHHILLCILMLWLGSGFALFPVASASIYGLVCLFSMQVLPRPWIGQMTNLLVSELYEDASRSSAAQSFNQGGFALGCVATLLLNHVVEGTLGTAATFYLAAGITAVAALLFCCLPTLSEEGCQAKSTSCCQQVPSLFTAQCAGLGVLAVGIEVACGTWLITCLTQTGFSSGSATGVNLVFWVLFAASRLIIAPLICRHFNPQPASVVIAGSAIAALCSLPALMLPKNIMAVSAAAAAVATGLGPAYAMTITMAKQCKEINSADSALFSVAASLGAGAVPFGMSRVIDRFGHTALFPALTCISMALLVLTGLLSQRKSTTRLTDFSDLEVLTESKRSSQSIEVAAVGWPVPAVIWMWWEGGWNTAPLVCQACAESWKLSNVGASVRTLDASDLPDLLPQLSGWERLWELPPAQRADIIRLELLYTYGGVWADATLFCTAPIMPWLQTLKLPTDDFFFVFDRSDSATWPTDPFRHCNLLISNWFIACTPQHPMTGSWLKRMKSDAEKPTMEYFAMHHAFSNIISEDPNMLDVYLRMPKLSAGHPHMLEFDLGFTAPNTKKSQLALQEALSRAPLQKLSHKILGDRLFGKILHEGTETSILGYLFSVIGNKLLGSFRRRALLRAKSHDLRSVMEREGEAKAHVYTSWQITVHTTAGNKETPKSRFCEAGLH